MKKILLFTALILLLLQAPVTVTAHGHHGGGHHGSSHAAQHPCNMSSCRRTGTHTHSGRQYYGHTGKCITYG